MRFGENRHGRRGEVGKDVYRRSQRNNAAINEQQCRRDDHDQPVLDRPLNDFVQHKFIEFRNSNFEFSCSLHLVRMRAGVCGPQFLKLQLIGALRHNALSWLQARTQSRLWRHIRHRYHVSSFELFARTEDVHDLLAFVIQYGFSRDEKHCRLRTSVQTNVCLHADTQFAGSIVHFENGCRRTCLFIDDCIDVNQPAREFLVGKCRRRKSDFSTTIDLSEIFFKDRRFDPYGVEGDNFEDRFSRRNLFTGWTC